MSGWVGLQGRADASGVTITTNAGASTVTIGGTPNFTLILAPGAYGLAATMPGFLGASAVNIQVIAGQTTSMPNVALCAGDTDLDGTIGLAELSLVGANFGKSAGFAPGADVNGDHLVNIYDLVLVGGNFGRSGIQPW